MMLESRNVVKSYAGKAAVDHMSFSIESGHIYGLLGPNGSGKSTWMKIAAGLIIPDDGEMRLDGIPIGVETKKRIAYMPTEPFYYSYMKIKDVARYYEDFFEDFDRVRFERIIADMQLDMQMKVRTLSSGMMAKLKIAATLSRRAEIYLLDEPLNGIDLLAREEVIRTILECMDNRSALVISSHLVEELEKIIDYVIFMKQGHLVLTGDVDSIRQQRGESIVELYKEIYR
jgi:ABC-2 type transport system ATP-binding protein